MPGPRIRSDIGDLYIFRRTPAIEFLQLRRVGGSLHGSWHPVMGGIEEGETAPEAMLREMHEEVGLEATDRRVLGYWALGAAGAAYLPPRRVSEELILIGPKLALEVAPGWEPTLNDEHDGVRWIAEPKIDALFMWPNQRAAAREVISMLEPGCAAEPFMKLELPGER